MENIPYINAVGSLMYLATMTHPDIAQFNSNPRMAHWKAVKHLFCHLKGTLDMKLEYSPDPSIGNDMFITSGYIVKLGSRVVCWQSKLTRSTTKVEYIAAGAAGMEICWVQNLLKELGYTPSAPAKLC